MDTLTDYGQETQWALNEKKVDVSWGINPDWFVDAGEEIKDEGFVLSLIAERDRQAWEKKRLMYVLMCEEKGKVVVGMSRDYDELFSLGKSRSKWVVVDVYGKKNEGNEPVVWEKVDDGYRKLRLRTGLEFAEDDL